MDVKDTIGTRIRQVRISLDKLGVDMKWLLLGNADTSSMMVDQRPINTMSLLELKRVQIQQMLTKFEIDELLVLENLLSLINKKKESK